MLKLSVALSRRILPRLCEGVAKAEGLRTWLEKGSFYVESGPALNSICLKRISIDELAPYITYDYERFCLSSYESLIATKYELAQPKAFGWPVIKLYYAAFFAAHAMMRATGKGILRLEAKQARRITEYSSLFGASLVVTTGTYKFSLVENNDGTKDLLLWKLADAGGAHDQFWKEFNTFLDDLSQDVSVKKEIDATIVIGEINDIQKILKASNSPFGTWLTSVRNQINYQHKYGVWFPNISLSKDEVKCSGYFKVPKNSVVKLDKNPRTEPLVAFSACCQVLAAINIDVCNGIKSVTRTKRFTQIVNRLEKLGA